MIHITSKSENGMENKTTIIRNSQFNISIQSELGYVRLFGKIFDWKMLLTDPISTDSAAY